MTKILIVSDSHGQTKELDRVKQKHQNEVDLMLHCGDSELMANHPSIQGFVTVRGNCDYEENFNEQIVEEIGSVKIFLTHGHLYSVKTSLLNLLYRAREHHVQIVCFGHSHELGAEMVDGVLFINPGSLRLPRGRTERTYVILEIENLEATLKVFEYDKGEINGLRRVFSLTAPNQ